jgi:hypothetical protein
MKKPALALVMLACSVSWGCRKNVEPPLYRLFDDSRPILTVGADLEDPDARPYRIIDRFVIDRSGNIFVANDIEFSIDKYDRQGRFLSAIGRKGQGPGEFADGRRIPSFGIDSRGLIYTSSLRSRIVVLNPDGSLNGEHEFPAEAKGYYVHLIKIAPNDDIHVMFYRPGEEIRLARISAGFTDTRIYHRGRARPGRALGEFLYFLPDFDFDRTGNALVTDGFEYRLYVYSPAGELIRTLERPAPKNKIVVADLALYSGKGEELIDFSQDPNAIRSLESLPEQDSYFPAVFGVNALDDGLILWTSNRDAVLKYFFDIYDKEFRLIGRGSAYNWVVRNSALVSEKRICLLDMGSDDMEFKKKIGRLSPFEYPSRILVYEMALPAR